LLLIGCASVPDDRGWSQVGGWSADRGQVLNPKPGTHCDGDVGSLLAAPLSLSNAATLALLCNPRIDASYARLGLAGADVLKAGRLANPLVSASYGFASGPGAVDRFGFGITTDFLDLLLIPAKTKLAKADLTRAQLEAANEVFALTAEVRRNWFCYVAARQSAQLQEAIADAADTAAQYADHLFKAGNVSELELSLRQADAAATQLQQLRAQDHLMQAREALQRSMGLGAGRHWETPVTLPLPVANEDAVEGLRTLAQTKRLDLAAADARVTAATDALHLARGAGWFNGAGIGATHERGTDGIASTGPEMSVALPLFSQGQGPVMAAQAGVEAAQADAAALRLDVDEQIAQAQSRLERARSELELLQTQLLPARARVTEQTQKQLNYMLAGTFELLLARQQQYDAFQRYDDALRDYWLARIALAEAVGTVLPSDAGIGPAEFAIDSLLKTGSAGANP
jgi:cobalt-zinc-cadmium efflux system outer membrane protein